MRVAAVVVVFWFGVSSSLAQRSADRQPTPQRPDEPGGLIAVGAVSATVRPGQRDASEERVNQLRAPDGVHVGVFARDLQNPRSIAVAPDGTVCVAE